MRTIKALSLAALALALSAPTGAAQSRIPAAYAGTATGNVYRIDLCTGTEDWSTTVSGSVECVAAARLGTTIVVGSSEELALFDEDGSLIWSVPTGVNPRNLIELSQVAIDEKGDYIVAAHADASVRLYHRSSPVPIWTHFTAAASVAITWPGNHVVAGGSLGMAYYAAGFNGWDALDGTPVWVGMCTGIVYSVDITKMENAALYMVGGTANSNVCLWRNTSNIPIWSYTSPKGDFMSVAMNPSGDRVAVGNDDSSDSLGAELALFSTLHDGTPGWHAGDNVPDWTYMATNNAGDDVRCVEFESTAPYHLSGSGDDFASGGSGYGVYEHNENSGTPAWTGTPDRESEDIAFMELDPYPSYVATCDVGSTGVVIFRTDQSLPLHTFPTTGNCRSISMPTGPIAGNVGFNYCVGAPNSQVAQGATISAWGSNVVTDNDFTLAAIGCTANEFGAFFYAPAQAILPFADGFLCAVGGPVRLWPPILTDGCGVIQLRVDLNLPPAASTLLPATIWNFQFWYRDPGMLGGTGSNLSDALEVPFQ